MGLDEFIQQIDKAFNTTNDSNIRTWKGDAASSDVPSVDDGSYVTHKAGGLVEVDEKDKNIPETKSEEPAVDMNQDAGDMGIGADQGSGFGSPEDEEGPKTASEVGKAYELKKIYARLISIESHLTTSSNSELLKIRNQVSKAIDLFRAVISNFDLYKDKINDITVLFYKFIVKLYEILDKYYKTNKDK